MFRSHGPTRERLVLFLFWAVISCGSIFASSVDDGVSIALSWGNVTNDGTLLVLTCRRSRAATDCCSAMSRAAASLLDQHPREQSMLESLTTRQASLQCEQEGSLVVPKVIESSPSFIYQTVFPKGQSGINQPRTYLWDDAEKRGRWWGEEEEETSKDTDTTISAQFESVISQSGGMHRTMDHTLSMDASSTSLVTLQELEAFFLILVPKDMFMDAEDAFGEHRWKVQGLLGDYNHTLELRSDQVIDIEQPSFGSPQHAVVVRLHLQAPKNAASIALNISFSTKIHLRYPSPVGHASSLYQPVVLIPPVLMGGTLKDETDTIVTISPTFSKPHLLQFLFSSPTSTDGALEFLTTQVASAPEDDFAWVATLTVLFSVLGAAYLGYETSMIRHE